MPVHLYGLSCDMGKISKIARNNNLFIVKDCAQSFGASIDKRKTGSLSDCGAFSFFPSKNLGGFGDGRLITTNNKDIAKLIKVLRNHGQASDYNASFIGYNSRLDSIQAAVLLAKLKHIDKFNNARIKIAKKYTEAFKNIPQICSPTLNTTHVYHQYTIKVSSRNALLKHLNSKGIGARVYYPFLLSGMKAFKGCKAKGVLKNAKKACAKCLSLPIHPFLKEKEISYITSAINKVYLSC